jgi:hypothetical protein
VNREGHGDDEMTNDRGRQSETDEGLAQAEPELFNPAPVEEIAGQAGPGRRERQDNLLPESQNNPAHGRGGDDQEAYTGRPDQDVTKATGAGTGGATESDGRVSHHEGVHLGNQPNS